jgi:hypothetical protein
MTLRTHNDGVQMATLSGYGADWKPTQPETRFPSASRTQIPLLIQIGSEAFGDLGPARHGVTRVQFYERLLAINPRLFRFIIKDVTLPVTLSNVAGMTCVVPLRTSVLGAYGCGKLSQFEFGAREIVAADSSEPRDFYLQAVYLRPGSETLFGALLSSVTRTIADFCPGARLEQLGEGGARIFGEATTASGSQIMTAFAMRPCGTSKDGNAVYLLDSSREQPAAGRRSYARISALVAGHARS